MRKGKKIFILVIIFSVSLTIIKIRFAPDINIVSIVINWFPHIEKRGNLDETWDYAIVDNPDKSGKNKWEIGLTDSKVINIYETASAPVVRVNVFKAIDMDYTSMEDYYNRGGSRAFRKFIEAHNK